MIDLGHIRLQHPTAVHDARNKVRSLANALGYDAIEATRLAIAVSEASRALIREAHEPRIAVGLEVASSPRQLVLDFEARDNAPELGTNIRRRDVAMSPCRYRRLDIFCVTHAHRYLNAECSISESNV